MEVLEVADAPETVDPADVLPAEPTPPRTRPSRASVRPTRRPTPGEPARLRAVPPVEPAPTHDEGQASDPGTRHTQASQEGGWEHALTSGLQSRAEKLVGAVLEGAEFSSESRPGPTELVELAVNVLRAAATSAGVPAEEAERQVAETLAYLRRRLTGDYVVDEFGFDEDYTEQRLPAAAAARSTRSGSASRCAASRTSPPRAARSSSPTTPAPSRWTR